MRSLAFALAATAATSASADLSCTLKPARGDDATTLLIRDLSPNDEAVVLVAGRTMIFECPAALGGLVNECYGRTKAPMNAPTQLNIAANEIAPGAIVVVTTRNQFFDRKKNARIGMHRRHASVNVYSITACETS